MRNTLTAAALIGALLLLALPASSFAGVPIDPNLDDVVLGKAGGVRYAAEFVTYNGDGFAEATAGCGTSSWHLIGGGAMARGGTAQAWQAFDRPDDYSDADLQPDDGFLGSGFGPTGSSFRTYSICVKDTQLKYVSTSAPSQPSSSRSASASCGAGGWHVTSGSGAIATSNSWLTSSFPTDNGDAGSVRDNGWKATADDTVNGAGGFSVNAICAKGLHLRYVHGSAHTVAAGSGSTAKVSCAANEHVVGGGARVSGSPTQARLVTSAPADGPDSDAVPDDLWLTTVYNVSGPSKQVTAYAICLKS
jgi:hypothetical protein